MTRGRARAHVPTLTEVVQVTPAPPPEPLPATAESVPLENAALDEGQTTQRVLADVQRQLDVMLEHRLREAVAPALARASDALIRDLRSELASTLRDIVERAVAQELERRRGR
jgi:hypothetical protein